MKKIIEMTPEQLDQAIRAANEMWRAKHVAEGDALKKEEDANLRKFVAKLKWPPVRIQIRCACGETVRLSHMMTRDGTEIYQDICSNCNTIWMLHGTTVSAGWNRHTKRELVPPIIRPIVFSNQHSSHGRHKTGNSKKR